jgi:hypothetical protein
MEKKPVTFRPRTSPALMRSQGPWQMAPMGLWASPIPLTRARTSGLRLR